MTASNIEAIRHQAVIQSRSNQATTVMGPHNEQIAKVEQLSLNSLLVGMPRNASPSRP